MERHPITRHPELPLERRCELLEENLARLWDQVWWLSLTPEQRADYENKGFAAPIQQFYLYLPE